MTKEPYISSKWPMLIVKGNKVTEDQALDIIFRTNNYYIYGNDRNFREQMLRHIYEDISGSKYQEVDKSKKVDHVTRHYYQSTVVGAIEHKLNVINLEYLNNSRIDTPYIFGRHGWCDWNGNIQCANYNIGKWPQIEEVNDDLLKIAQAFPYLTFKMQLTSCESSEIEDNDFEITAEFEVSNGTVKSYYPEKQELIFRDNSEREFLPSEHISIHDFYKKYAQWRGS